MTTSKYPWFLSTLQCDSTTKSIKSHPRVTLESYVTGFCFTNDPNSILNSIVIFNLGKVLFHEHQRSKGLLTMIHLYIILNAVKGSLKPSALAMIFEMVIDFETSQCDKYTSLLLSFTDTFTYHGNKTYVLRIFLLF